MCIRHDRDLLDVASLCNGVRGKCSAPLTSVLDSPHLTSCASLAELFDNLRREDILGVSRAALLRLSETVSLPPPFKRLLPCSMLSPFQNDTDLGPPTQVRQRFQRPVVMFTLS